MLFLIPVDVIKRKWKSLRDNFRSELKKVPIGKSGDSGLPVDQYLSKWPYFRMLFFLRDTMIGRRMSGNLTAAMAIADSEQSTSSCASPALSHQSTQEVSEILLIENDFQEPSEVESGTSQKSSVRRKRIRDSTEIETEKLICIEREKVEIEKRKLKLLMQDNERKEREENDSDRLFLLSLLPNLKKVPENEKQT